MVENDMTEREWKDPWFDGIQDVDPVHQPILDHTGTSSMKILPIIELHGTSYRGKPYEEDLPKALKRLQKALAEPKSFTLELEHGGYMVLGPEAARSAAVILKPVPEGAGGCTLREKP